MRYPQESPRSFRRAACGLALAMRHAIAKPQAADENSPQSWGTTRNTEKDKRREDQLSASAANSGAAIARRKDKGSPSQTLFELTLKSSRARSRFRSFATCFGEITYADCCHGYGSNRQSYPCLTRKPECNPLRTFFSRQLVTRRRKVRGPKLTPPRVNTKRESATFREDFFSVRRAVGAVQKRCLPPSAPRFRTNPPCKQSTARF